MNIIQAAHKLVESEEALEEEVFRAIEGYLDARARMLSGTEASNLWRKATLSERWPATRDLLLGVNV